MLAHDDGRCSGSLGCVVPRHGQVWSLLPRVESRQTVDVGEDLESVHARARGLDHAQDVLLVADPLAPQSSI